MGWFRKAGGFEKALSVYKACAECGMCYAPVLGVDERWGHLCPIHRAPAREADLKRDLVLRWAERNWERLHDQAAKEESELAGIRPANLLNMGQGCALGANSLFSTTAQVSLRNPFLAATGL